MARPPARLHVDGILAERSPSVAIVGARAASRRAMDRAESLGSAVARAGGIVISGGALGVDAAAHRGALDAGGETVAIMACGLDRPYPERNRQLFARIRSSGALLSVHPPGIPPKRWHFVRRNRLIAASADLVLVIEAESRSGALHTARAAAELGAVLAASPGSPGCEALLSGGAAAVEVERDLFEALAGRPRHREVSLPAAASASGQVFAALAAAAQSCEDLALALAMPPRSVFRALLELELEGLAVSGPGEVYSLSKLAARAGGRS